MVKKNTIEELSAICTDYYTTTQNVEAPVDKRISCNGEYF